MYQHPKNNFFLDPTEREKGKLASVLSVQQFSWRPAAWPIESGSLCQAYTGSSVHSPQGRGWRSPGQKLPLWCQESLQQFPAQRDLSCQLPAVSSFLKASFLPSLTDRNRGVGTQGLSGTFLISVWSIHPTTQLWDNSPLYLLQVFCSFPLKSQGVIQLPGLKIFGVKEMWPTLHALLCHSITCKQLLTKLLMLELRLGGFHKYAEEPCEDNVLLQTARKNKKEIF